MSEKVTKTELEEEDEGNGRRRGIKTLRDVQKVQLEKLMANPVSI
jgi:hypothetical protein